jgi:hypothetical protein
MSRLSRQCGILNISQPYRSPRPVTGIAFTLNGNRPKQPTPLNRRRKYRRRRKRRRGKGKCSSPCCRSHRNPDRISLTLLSLVTWKPYSACSARQVWGDSRMRVTALLCTHRLWNAPFQRVEIHYYSQQKVWTPCFITAADTFTLQGTSTQIV